MQMTENLLEKVTMGERLWAVHCGFAPAPTAYQFGLWLKRWTLRELEYALDRASVKFRHQIMGAATVDYVHRYVTSVMVKQSEYEAYVSKTGRNITSVCSPTKTKPPERGMRLHWSCGAIKPILTSSKDENNGQEISRHE